MQAQPLLPHQTDRIFLTDGGIETWLMYKRGFELPHFSAYQLLDDPAGRAALEQYYRDFAALARERRTAYIFCSLTYRASRDWGRLLGFSDAALADMNGRTFEFYRQVATESGCEPATTLYSGCIGPRGDAYDTKQTITAAEAEDYHAPQLESFRSAGADLATALTLKSTEEAIGIARAAKSAGVPSVISFTLEKNGTVGGTKSLKEAIASVDAATAGAPAYYMVNCSHPIDFTPALDDGSWVQRIRGLRANASSLAHGQLCQLGHLDEGDPADLATRHGDLRRRYPHINVFGGCCGTDHVHVSAICAAVQPARSSTYAP